METSGFAPIGLQARNIDDMLDQIRAAGFNTPSGCHSAINSWI
jgi:hypothetical protein